MLSILFSFFSRFFFHFHSVELQNLQAAYFCNNVFQLWILINYLYSISMVLFAVLGPICQLILFHFVFEPIIKAWKFTLHLIECNSFTLNWCSKMASIEWISPGKGTQTNIIVHRQWTKFKRFIEVKTIQMLSIGEWIILLIYFRILLLNLENFNS